MFEESVASSRYKRVSLVYLQKLTLKPWALERSMWMFAPAQKNLSPLPVITMTAVPGSGYKGAANLTFQRLTIDTDVVAKGTATDDEFDKGSATQISDIVALLNTRFSVNLVAGTDYTDGALPAFDGTEPNETKTFTLTILAGSLVYKGSVVLTVKAGDVDLAGRTTGLDGFTYDGPTQGT